MRYVYCYPLFDERKCGHRFSYQLAKVFEENNLRLERFDYRGTGEREGAFCDVSVESLKSDVREIIGGDRVCLIGTRLGATIALDFWRESEFSAGSVILIEPIVNGSKYVEYLFRKQRLKDMMTGNRSEAGGDDGFCNLEGFKVSDAFIEQIRRIDLVKTAEKIKSGTKVYVVEISGCSRVNPEYEFLAKQLKENEISACVEVFNLPMFWERIPDGDYSSLAEKIVEWCR